MDNIMNQYQAVLADLELRRNRCQKELTELEQTIAGLRKVAAATASLFTATPAEARSIETGQDLLAEASKRYAGMSVRWSILKLLAEHSPGPFKSSEIAGLLASGGIVSAGRDFGANVSAVISDMVNKRKELEQGEPGYYLLSDTGRLAWAAIKHSPKYVNRGLSFPTLQ